MSVFLARACGACLLLAAVVLVAIAQPVHAATADVLSLRQAVERALEGNPDLRAFAFTLRAQEARIDAAGLRPAPVVSATVENALGTGAAARLDGAELTFSLSRVVELGDKRSRRLDLARSGRESLDVERAAAQLDLVAEVGRRYIAVARAERELQLAGRGAELARATVEAVQRRVAAARSPDVELARAQVEQTRARLVVRDAEQTLRATRRRLAATWGATEADFGAVGADLFVLPQPASFESLLARLHEGPDLARFASEARLRDAAVRLAESRRRADLQWSAGVRRLQSGHDQALVFGLSMPLFAGRLAEPAVAEARALRGQVDVQREAALVRARAQLYELHQALDFAIEEAAVLGDEVLPQVQQALRDTEYAYERGRYGFVELIDAQRAALEAEHARIAAAARAQELQNEIERLAAVPLAAGASESATP